MVQLMVFDLGVKVRKNHLKDKSRDVLNPKDPFVCPQGFRDFIDPILPGGPGIWDHESYEFSGGIWILNSKEVTTHP